MSGLQSQPENTLESKITGKTGYNTEHRTDYF